MSYRPIHQWLLPVALGVVLGLAVLLLALRGVSTSGEATETPAIVGSYVLDREATHAAQSAFAAGWPGESGQAYRDLARKTAGGENVVRMTISTDGTWNTKYISEGRTTASSGTWSLEGDELALEYDAPQVAPQGTVRYRDGVIEILGHNETLYWVLRRDGAR